MKLAEMKARLSAIVAELEKLNGGESFTDQDVELINKLNDEFENLQKQIVAFEKIEAMQSAAQISNRKVAPQTSTEIKNEKKPAAAFATVGDFFKAVAHSAGGQLDGRLVNVHQEKDGSQGGFLIPTDFRTEIQKKVTGDESLLVKTFQLTSASNNLTLPVDEIAPWDSVQGVQAYWEGEAGQYKESGTSFGVANLRLNKLTALVKVTEELLEDAPALESYLKAKAPAAMLHKINSAIINGDGVGKPKGFLKSGFKVMVAKEAAQTADTIVYENIVKMYSRMLPMSIRNAIWLVHAQVPELLRMMKFDKNATSPVPAYMPPSGLADAPYGTLMGRPIMPMMAGVSAVGDEGDISFVDLQYYTTVVKTAGIKSDVSTHVYFDKDIVAYKFSMRIAGECFFKEPVTTEKGDYKMSAFVTLESR